MEQKFKRGNLVRVLVGKQILSSNGGVDISPDDVGRTALIQYSYNDQYGGGDVDSYSIMWTDTGGTVSWKSASELELIEEGGEHLFKAVKDNVLQRTSILLKYEDFVGWVMITNCCKIGPITSEKYCPECGRKIIKT